MKNDWIFLFPGWIPHPGANERENDHRDEAAKHPARCVWTGEQKKKENFKKSDDVSNTEQTNDF